MLTTKIYLLITAGIIITALASYAVYLHIQLKNKITEAARKDASERQLAQNNLDKRNNNIIADIRFIAKALISEQCEITEGVLRIHHLSDALDIDIMQQQSFSTIHNHFNQCKSMAIKEAYKALSKKERFQQDQQRLRLEERHKDDVLKEAQLIIEYSFDNLKNLH
jgi:hypothetical protein